jgi:hypothetical protein
MIELWTAALALKGRRLTILVCPASRETEEESGDNKEDDMRELVREESVRGVVEFVCVYEGVCVCSALESNS